MPISGGSPSRVAIATKKGPVVVKTSTPKAPVMTPASSPAALPKPGKLSSTPAVRKLKLPGPIAPQNVKIKTPQVTPKAVSKVTPQQVAATNRWVKQMEEAQQHSGAGPLGIAAVHPLHIGSGIIHGIGHVAEGIGKDAVHLPIATGVGIEHFGKTSVDDSIKGYSDLFHGHILKGLKDFDRPLTGSKQGILTQSAVPYEQLAGAHGGLAAVGHNFATHPLLTAMQYLPIVDSPGRVAGTVARTGALGDRAAEIAATARAPEELASGVAGPERHYSTNIMVKHLQKQIDEGSGAWAKMRDARTALKTTPANFARSVRALRSGDKREQIAVNDRMNKLVDHIYASHASLSRHAMDDQMRDLTAHLKGSTQMERDNLSHAINGQIRSRATARVDLSHVQSRIQEAIDNDEQGIDEFPTREARDAAHQQNNDLTSLLNSHDFDKHVDKIMEMKQPVVDQIKALDERAKERGILGAEQAERRPMMTYAMQHMGARMATKDDFLPGHFEHLQAKQDLRQATKNVTEAQTHYNKIMGIRGRGTRMSMDADVRDAQAKLARAEKSEARLIGQHTGQRQMITRYSKNPDMSKIAQKLGDAFNRTATARDTAENAVALRAEEQKFMRGDARDQLNAAKDTQSEAAARTLATRQFHNQRFKGMVYDDAKGDTHTLSTDAIRQHMEDNGVSPVAYVSARTPAEENAVQLSAKWRGSRGDTPDKHYTGESTDKGMWDSTAHGLSHSITRAAHRLTTTQNHDYFIDSTAVAKHMTPQEALDYKRVYEEQHPGIKLQPMYEHAKGLNDDQVAKIRSEQDKGRGNLYDERLHNQELLSAREVRDAGDDPEARVSLVPQAALKRYRENVDADAGQSQGMMRANRVFRNAVLPWSTKWLVGNTAEAGLRLALNGSDMRFMTKVMDRMTPEERQEFLARTGATDGQHFGSAQRSNYEALVQKHGEEGAAQQMIVKRSLPRLKHPIQTMRDQVFKLNHHIENAAVKGAIGAKMQRDMVEMAGSWKNALDHQEEYLEALAKGAATPAKAEAYARDVHEVLGKYSGFSPAARKIIQQYAPFGAWYANSMRFVYHTLPVGHPYAQAALLANEASNQHALNPTQPYAMDFAGSKFGDLANSVKDKDGGYTNYLRYTPMGAFTDSGPTGAALSPIGAQGLSVLQEAQGLNPYGEQVKDQNGNVVQGYSGQATMDAINELLTSHLGPVGNLARVMEDRGRTEYGTSTIWHPELKPGTAKGHGIIAGINKVFNPVHPTYLSAPSNSKSGPVNPNSGLNGDVNVNTSDGNGGINPNVGLK